MNQLSKVVILNHHTREKEGKFIAKTITGVETDIAFDDGTLGVWKNYKQAWRKPSEPERFRLVIHDDIIFSRNALDSMKYILSFMPDDCFVSFYVPDTQGYRDSFNARKHIMKTHSNFWTQAFATSSSLKERCIEWCDRTIDEAYKWEDRRIVSFCHHNNIPVYCILPSLVQHAGAYRSTQGMAGKIGNFKRYSMMYDPDFDVKQVDWRGELNDPYLFEATLDYKKIHEKAIRND